MISMVKQSWTESIRSNRSWTILSVEGHGPGRRRSCVWQRECSLSMQILSSLWPLLYGTSCCFIEFASLIGSRFDFDRYGLVPRSSPRQADLILTASTVTMKMAPSLVRLYEQMPEPKYVIAIVLLQEGCCPPKPEAVIDAITKLRKKVSREIYEDRFGSQQNNR
ncbi:hypothetical protein C5167_016225, partial [Papaver somniferum]